MRRLSMILLALLASVSPAPADPQPPFTIREGVELAAMHIEREWGGEVALKSPTGKQWAVVTKKGDLSSNLNRYRLYMYEPGRPIQEALQMTTATNSPAISNLRWSSDGNELSFLGTGEAGPVKPYILRVPEAKLQTLPGHTTHIQAFARSPEKGRTVLAVHSEPEVLFRGNDGLWVEGQSVREILRGEAGGGGSKLRLLSVQPSGTKREIEIQDCLYPNDLFQLSPDGRFLATHVRVRRVPQGWLGYTMPVLAQALRAEPQTGQFFDVWRLIVVDLETEQVRYAVDAPSWGASPAVFSPDSKSLLIVNSFLPLNGDPQRLAGRFTYTMSLEKGEIEVLTDQSVETASWPDQPQLVLRGKKEATGSPRLVVEENISTPPRLYFENQGDRQLVLDLNPGFDKSRLVEVRQLEWQGKDGCAVKGGLFVPPARFKKPWPLVIQTHGWNPKRFSVEGSSPMTTGYAAQALAQSGIAVVQMEDGVPQQDWTTGAEAPAATEAYRGLISKVVGEGLADSSRIGLSGFSRTCYHVRYALALSDLPIAAAFVGDGIDAGYVGYLLARGGNNEDETMYGSAPFGDGIQNWLSASPGFNLHRVQAPVLLHGVRSGTGLGELEWFSGLRYLKKPVELFLLKDGVHIAFRPADRVASGQAALDWYRFWLQGEVDPDPNKKERFKRWNEWKLKGTPER